MGTFGITDFDSSNALCKDGTIDKNNPSNPCVNNGGVNFGQARPFDFVHSPFGGKLPMVNPTTDEVKQQAQLEIARQQSLAQQQALVQQMTTYSGLTDKFFGKTEGYGIERTMKLGAYIILGAVIGRYVAKNMKKSTTLGMVLGGLAPLLAFKLTIEYDKKNMPKQEPRQKVAIEPTPTPKPNMPQVEPSGLGFSKYPMECMMKYALQPKEAVMMPAEYWKKREEDWMKTNCK